MFFCLKGKGIVSFFLFFLFFFNDLQAQIPSAATARTWYCNSCSLRLTAGLILNKKESFKGFNYKMKFFFKSHVCSLAWSRLTLNLGEHHISEVPGIADLLWPTHFCDYLRYSQSYLPLFSFWPNRRKDLLTILFKIV